jgi:hypothetical protein
MQQILGDYPQREPDDFLAVHAYAAELAARAKWLGAGIAPPQLPLPGYGRRARWAR